LRADGASFPGDWQTFDRIDSGIDFGNHFAGRYKKKLSCLSPDEPLKTTAKVNFISARQIDYSNGRDVLDAHPVRNDDGKPVFQNGQKRNFYRKEK